MTLVPRLAIALTSTTAIVAAFSLAATPPATDPAGARPATGATVVIELADQHDEGSTSAAVTAGEATWQHSVFRDC